MSDPNRQGDSGSVRAFFGYTFLAIGWLVAGTSGLCTTVGAVLFGGVAIVIGVGPIIAGAVMILIGRRLLRQAKPPDGTTPESQAQSIPPSTDGEKG